MGGRWTNLLASRYSVVTFVLLALRQLSGELADPFGEADPAASRLRWDVARGVPRMQVGSFETKFEGPLELEPSQELAFIPLSWNQSD